MTENLSDPEGLTQSDAERSAQIRGSSGLALGRVVALLLGLAVQVIIVRTLTKAGYGAFAYAMSLVPALRLAVSLGTAKATSRFLALYREQGDGARLAGLLVLQTFGFVVVGALVWIVFASTSLAHSLIPDDTIRRVLLILIVLAPVEALDDMFEGFFATFSKPSAIFVRKYVIGPASRLVAVLAVALIGGGPVELAIGYVLGGLIGMATYIGLGTRVLKTHSLQGLFRPGRFILPIRELLTFSVPLLTAEALYLSMNSLAVVVLERSRGAEAVAEYRAVFPLARLNHFVMWAFAVLFVPLAARFFARNDQSAMRDAYWTTAAWIGIFTFPVFAVTGPMAAASTDLLFGSTYAAAAPVLGILSVGYYLNSILAFNALTLQTWGLVRFVSVVNVVAAGANAALLFVLADRLGPVGVAIANALTLLAVNVVNQIRLHRLIDVGLYPRGSGRMYLRIAIASGLLWFLERTLQWPTFADLALAAVVSLAVLRLSRSDLDAANIFPEIRRLPVLRWFV